MNLEDCAVGQIVKWQNGTHKYEGMIVSTRDDLIRVVAHEVDGQQTEIDLANPNEDEDWIEIDPAELTLVESEQAEAEQPAEAEKE